MKAIDKLNEMFDIGQKENTPVFKDLTEDTYRQLETGIYNTWGRRLNITPRVLDENEIWTGKYKDWSHLQEIKINQGHFEYLNCTWLFRDQRQDRIFNCYCKEAYIFDIKVIVIQELHYDHVSAKVLTDNEELKLHIEDILQFKPMNVVPEREIREINDLEYQGLEFGSSQLKINMNTAEEKLDKYGQVITNIDHYDNYVYEIYDSLRNIFKHISREDMTRKSEEKIKWLEEWLEKPLSNDIQSIMAYMSDKVRCEISKYTYQAKDIDDRKTCGGYLYDEVKIKEFSIDDMDYVIREGKKMEEICLELEIPVTIGWDIWKILNKRIMEEEVKLLYRENPL